MENLIQNIVCPDCNSKLKQKYIGTYTLINNYYLSCKCNIAKYNNFNLDDSYFFEKNSIGIIIAPPDYYENTEIIIKFKNSKYKFNIVLDKFLRIYTADIIFNNLSHGAINNINDLLSNFLHKKVNSNNFIPICLDMSNVINKYIDNLIFE